MFKGRKLLIATKHKKEKAMASLLEGELGVQCIVAENFDTDLFGTFAGEIERKSDPITTARNKCLKALSMYGYDLVAASEGSFGPHPTAFFVQADEEIIYFMDTLNGLEIVTRELSIETNFGGEEIQSENQLYIFAERAKFPSHGLILRKSKDDPMNIVKGIIDQESLLKTYHHFADKYGKVFVETDMRAMYNPSRMNVINKATKKLIDKINTLCPQCNSPGFEITETKSGLPCDRCTFPTKAIISQTFTCKKCAYAKVEMFPNNKTTQDPMYCDLCNP